MQTYNEFGRVQRFSDFGMFYKEIISGAAGTINVPKFSVLRVRSIGVTTVTINGILSCTLMDGEIIFLNAGPGTVDQAPVSALYPAAQTQVTVVVAGDGAFVQLGIEQKLQFQP